MPAEWLSNSSAVSGRISAVVTGALSALAQPANTRRLRQVLLCLLALWAVLVLTRLLWALVPTPTASGAAAPTTIINPLSTARSRADATPVDIERMVGWHLFGKAGAEAVTVAEQQPAAQASARDGIEDGARQTSLQLVLRGIVASTEDGLGHAIIENRNQQAIYAVEDKLPVPGQVILAKVMPRQVVLDNGGTYELLVLFDESSVGTAVPSAPAPMEQAPADGAQMENRSDVETTSLAQSYRERLYQNPQSLAEVVNLSAVREGNEMVGYRVNPGRDAEQFTQLGFQAGDVVISVNGISLDTPANTMALYNAMRTAGEAVFELQRADQQLTLSVNLDSGAAQ